ncbi:MAG: hypothetical protein M3281_04480, partial [Chloroflexota bacterium]|nr:hypothetical protein [Chloroflexota bacterium]
RQIGTVGRVQLVEEATAERGFTGGSTLPSASGARIAPEEVRLDVVGEAAPVPGSQPTQRELGVEPPSPGNDEDLALVDTGTDFRRAGFAGDPRAQDATELAGLGYFQVETSLDTGDLYLPLEAVRSADERGVQLDMDSAQLTDLRWHRPPDNWTG